ncbi:MAG: aldehyde dehydrogenase family protein, partial [Actinobacteria bacterium]|nr:aldehyde dehydrogenase family protein [Actinomycetota bacterium]
MSEISTKVAERFSSAENSREFKMLIDGEWVSAASGETFTCVDPYDGVEWGSVPAGGAEDVDRAVRAAARAFAEGEWAELTPPKRAALLRRIAARLEEEAETLARAQVHENGKLIGEMRMSIQLTASDAYFFAGLAEALHGLAPTPPLENVVCYTRREPLGVVGAITPWNTPIGLLAWKLLPALAAGNTMVIKPSEVTPTSTLLLGELLQDAGLPPGVVNVVTGFGDPAGSALVRHPGVAKVAFTGSTATGKVIGREAAERLARVTLELGGKSPNVVFADADLSNAVNGIMAGIFAAGGQTCMAGSRVLVQRDAYAEVAALLVERARQIRIGDPLDEGSQLPPVASRPQLDKVLSYISIGHEEG